MNQDEYDAAFLAELDDQLQKERTAADAIQKQLAAQNSLIVRTQNAIEVIQERIAARAGKPSTARKILSVAAQAVAAGAAAAVAYEQTKPYRRMTILTAARSYLTTNGPAKAPEITRALVAGGKTQATTNTVRSILDRAMRDGNGIEKVGTTWRIAEATKSSSGPSEPEQPVSLFRNADAS